MSHITHLVMVAGHAVWKGCDPANRLDEGDWLLEERQKGGGNVEAFFSHIKRGAEIIVADPNSLLIFSGGQTRPSSLTTEAQSYHRLAIESHLLGRPGLTNDTSPSNRVFSENYALDSYQNLLFSLARFREVTGSYPARITVVGFGMKKQRFEELHRRAIRWPKERFHYIGIDVKGDTSASYQGEAVYGFTPYSRDIYGCHDELLAKRRRRNPFHTFHPYHVSAPEMADLIEWCPEGKRNMLFSGALPWDYL
ncbi:hypothetical protein FRC02_000847 [Tulasnella sp. 418]|nr:hypothetical protein FRC02_000847 [Tulasnella sp. 418]